MQSPFLIAFFSEPEHRYTFVNSAYEKFFNVSEDKLIGRTLREVWPGFEGQGIFEVFDNVYKTGQAFSADEYPVTLNTGEAAKIGYYSFIICPVKDPEGNISELMMQANDVTLQVLSRQKIEESEKRFHSLATEFPLLVWLTDENLQTTFLNRTGFDYFNIDGTAKISEISWKKFIHPDDLERTLNIMKEAIRKHEPYTLKMRLRNGLTGQYHWFLDNGVPQYANEKFTGFVGTSTDIHEQKMAEETIRQNEEKYRQLSESLEKLVIQRTEELTEKNRQLNEAHQIAQLGSWDWDMSTGEIKWSEQMYRIYGFDEKAPISFEKATERMTPGDAVKARENTKGYIAKAQQLFKEKGVTEFRNPHFEYPISLPDGTKKILRGAGKIILSGDGKVSRIIGTVQDITDQKNIENKLIEINEKLEQRNEFVERLINSSLDLIMVVDKKLEFIKLNKKAESTIKPFYPGNLIGKRITEVSPALEGTQSYFDLLKAFEGEIIIRDKVRSTISEHYYEHNYVPLLDASGDVYAVMIISHDITESIKQMEELKKLNKSDKLKSDFIKMASHELKTPVTSIKGYVQLLLAAFQREDAKPISPSLVRLSLESIDKQINRLTRLMSELLDLSKIETGRLEPDKELFDLNEMVIETVQDTLYANTKHRISIAHDFRCSVWGDKDRIGQVLINLLTNAIKYSPGSDKVEVTVKKSGKKNVSVSVRDFGIGIDKKHHEKIFDRFYRAEDKEEQTYPGFGIGLFIAKEIIELHGGSIHLSSEKNKGSVFTFTIPVAN